MTTIEIDGKPHFKTEIVGEAELKEIELKFYDNEVGKFLKFNLPDISIEAVSDLKLILSKDEVKKSFIKNYTEYLDILFEHVYTNYI